MQLEEFYIPLQRESGIPLYIQIREAIRDALPEPASILPGEITLPAQRDLARRLGVSRNTVSMAYAELEREGLVVSEVGVGTVVVDSGGKMETRNREETLAKIIEHSTEEALALGITLDEYGEAVGAYLQEKKEMLRHIRLVFVECNREQLTYFSEHLRLDPGVVIIPLLLFEIREHPETALATLKSADLVVTSFYHLDELERVLWDSELRPVGITLKPETSTIVEIARIPEDAGIGLVAASNQFLAEIGETLHQMGVDFMRVRRTSADGGEDLARFVEGVDALIVSPSQRLEVEALAAGKQVVEFLFAPDDTAINNIRIALLELKRRRKEGKSDARTDHGAGISRALGWTI